MWKAYTMTTEGYIGTESLLYFYIHYSSLKKQLLPMRCAYLHRTKKPSKWLLSTLASLHPRAIFKKENKNFLD